MELSSPISFSTFAKLLATKQIEALAPPFADYAEAKGDIISYLAEKLSLYIQYVNALVDIEEVNVRMDKFMGDAMQRMGKPPVPVKFNLAYEVNSLCKCIIDALEEYFKGFPALSYEKIEDWFTKDECHMLNMLPQLEIVTGGLNMYRVRKGEHAEDKDLFHVPFNQRYKCANYRYSINGTPSFYCGASLQTCLLENRINAETDFTADLFRLPANEHWHVIDLGLPKCKLSLWEEYSLVLFYPLIMACGLKVRYEDKPFKPEYIISQLFYQVLRTHTIDDRIIGISYISTRYEDPDFTQFNQRNFVLFVKGCHQEEGYNLDLAKKLLTSGPVYYQGEVNNEALVALQRRINRLPLRPIHL